MNSLKLNILAVLACITILAAITSAQGLTFNYNFQFDATFLTQDPQVKDFHVNFPEEARKNGIDGSVKATFVFGKDGKIRDAVVLQDLPFGVGDALIQALTKMVFTPAANGNELIDLRAIVIYKITAVYSEYDDNITKVKLLSKLTAEYPSAFRADGIKGKVYLGVTFYPDGKIKVHNVQSTMPPEFDEAAKKAVENLKFQPAVLKKSKKQVAQTTLLVFEFKP